MQRDLIRLLERAAAIRWAAAEYKYNNYRQHCRSLAVIDPEGLRYLRLLREERDSACNRKLRWACYRYIADAG